MTIHTGSKPPLSVVTRDAGPNTGVDRREEIADGLADVLGDTYVMILKTHACHWNIEGPLFYSVHNLTEEHYKDMFAAADVLAERIRALGKRAPTNFGVLTDRAEIAETTENPTAGEMVQGLVESHEKIARRFRGLIETSADADAVTEDLATARTAFHEKAAWMLRALIAE